MAISVTVKYRIKGLPSTWDTINGGFYKYILILSKASWQSLPLYAWIFLSKQLEYWLASHHELGYKPSYVVQTLKKTPHFFLCLGHYHILDYLYFFELTYIPWLLITKPNSFPVFTPNEHFEGFSFNWNLHNLSTSILASDLLLSLIWQVYCPYRPQLLSASYRGTRWQLPFDTWHQGVTKVVLSLSSSIVLIWLYFENPSIICMWHFL